MTRLPSRTSAAAVNALLPPTTLLPTLLQVLLLPLLLATLEVLQRAAEALPICQHKGRKDSQGGGLWYWDVLHGMQRTALHARSNVSDETVLSVRRIPSVEVRAS
jgi:hypothetical protein